jgi:hypothetical protein
MINEVFVIVDKDYISFSSDPMVAMRQCATVINSGQSSISRSYVTSVAARLSKASPFTLAVYKVTIEEVKE